ncbi:MAG: O-methyltransferase [Chitinophagaceae bacterium]
MVIPQQVENYSSSYCSELSPLIGEVLNYTLKNHPHAHMVSGQEQGLLLQFFSRMIRPRRILEIGTFTGFSGLCLAEGLSWDGELHTIELREEDAATARTYFDRSPAKDRINLHVGDALAILPTLNKQWDLVFIDADKPGYIDYYDLVVPHLQPTGWILADNVLFHGEVLQEPITSKNARAIAAFNEHVKNDDRTEQMIATVRDGLMIIRKCM